MSKRKRSAFTLVELLVVVSIIALLLGILLPALGKARDVARSTACAANLRSIAQAMTTYATEYQVYPTAYLYKDENDNILPENQFTGYPHPGGYRHWSWFLFSNGAVKDSAFQCPSMHHGGLPRTNPGPEQRDWEDGQQDQNGATSPNDLVDDQASRMAYTANALVVPRNKFIPATSPVVNKQVNPGKVRRASSTILATEFVDNWKQLRENETSPVKSHRPIFPIYSGQGGPDPYKTPVRGFYYINGTQKEYDRTNPQLYGIGATAPTTAQSDGTLSDSSGPGINSIGRHHPGGDGVTSGVANFTFVDAHVEPLTTLQTMQNRLWGDDLYAFDFTKVKGLGGAITTIFDY